MTKRNLSYISGKPFRSIVYLNSVTNLKRSEYSNDKTVNNITESFLEYKSQNNNNK